MLKLQSSKNIYFISDMHIGHARIIKHANRPFENVEEMDEKLYSIIKGFKPKDIVFYLGDFARDKQHAEYALKLINCQWYFIRGNHDEDLDQALISLQNYFVDKHERNSKFISPSIQEQMNIQIDKQNITLNHWPMITWHKSHFNAWQIHGHHHWNTMEQERFQGKQLNVAVENCNYKPLTFQDVKRFMSTRPDNWDLVKYNDKKDE